MGVDNLDLKQLLRDEGRANSGADKYKPRRSKSLGKVIKFDATGMAQRLSDAEQTDANQRERRKRRRRVRSNEKKKKREEPDM